MKKEREIEDTRSQDVIKFRCVVEDHLPSQSAMGMCRLKGMDSSKYEGKGEALM